MRHTGWRQLGRFALAVVFLTLVAMSARAVSGGRTPTGSPLLTRVSQAVALRYWLAHPNQAPPQLQRRFAATRAAASPGEASGVAGLFNRDDVGLPQNEESVSVCPTNGHVVLGGTNDFRGILDPEGNFTGWHLSTDGGSTVANEGLLPPVHLPTANVDRPSGGDPVDVAASGCALYAGSLNFDPSDPFHHPNGVGVYKTDVATLASCPGGSDPSCWPTSRAVAESRPGSFTNADPGHFLDKEWINVGDTGDGMHVWAVFSDFFVSDEAPIGYTNASIYAVRCDANLVTCTSPIKISGSDQDIQFGDVTIGPDGRTYLTWAKIVGELPGSDGQPGQPQTFIIKMRIAPAGSTSFGPTMVVARENHPLAFGGSLHANDFRNATYPKNAVAMVDGHPRIFVTWDGRCRGPIAPICEEPVIKLTFSDDDGVSWSPPQMLSVGGDNYFPTISSGLERNLLAIAWFTNRFDPAFHNRQDVELVTVSASDGLVKERFRVTRQSNETEADPIVGGFFIGDYIEVSARAETVFVHYNANFRKAPLLGAGVPINQQDNFLTRVHI
jgi:hypothetical protein